MASWSSVFRVARLGGLAGATSLASCMSVQEWAQQPLDDATKARCAALEASADYVRADVGLMDSSKSGGGSGGSSHAIFETLGAKTNALRAYRIYSKRDGSEIVAIARLGACGLDGHRGIVHGGVTALLFDNTFGWANAVSKLHEEGDLASVLSHLEGKDDENKDPDATTEQKNSQARFGYTANLAVNYRSPVFADTAVQLRCKLDVVEGRKRKLVGTMEDLNSGRHLSDATALFIVPREAA